MSAPPAPPLYVRQRGGRWYWEPSRRLAALGHVSVPLGTDRAQAFGEGARLTRAALGDDPIASTPAGGRAPPRLTLGDLVRAYLASSDFGELAAATRRGYRQILGALPPPLLDIAAAAIDAEVVQARHRARAVAAPYAAAAELRVIRLVYAWARRALPAARGLDNPAERLRVKALRPRAVVPTRALAAALIAAADAAGRAWLGDLIALAYESAQRLEDCLSADWQDVATGRWRLAQSKTGAVVELDLAAGLRARLGRVPPAARAGPLIRLDDGARPSKSYAEHQFLRLRRAVAAEFAAAAAAPTATRTEAARLRALADGALACQLRDLRRGAVVEMAEGGATALQIAAVTGHRKASVEQILEVYAPRTSGQAAAAMAARASVAAAGGVARAVVVPVTPKNKR